MPFLSQLFHLPKVAYNRAMPEGYLTTKQTAERLGISEQAVRSLCERGKLQGEKFGPVWMIHEDAVTNFVRPKRGRPKKD